MCVRIICVCVYECVSDHIIQTGRPTSYTCRDLHFSTSVCEYVFMFTHEHLYVCMCVLVFKGLCFEWTALRGQFSSERFSLQVTQFRLLKTGPSCVNVALFLLM